MQQRLHVGRRRRTVGDLLTGDRVHELQRFGVQRLALEAAQFGHQLLAGALGQLQRAAIQLIADDRMTQVRHVHADLVGTAGFQAAFQRRVRAETLAQAVMGDRFLAVFAHGHADAIARVAVDTGGGSAAGNQRTHHHGQVLAMYFTCRELLDQRGLRLDRAGDDHHPAGVLVQTVHDARTRQYRQRGIAEQQRIDQGAGRVARAGVDHQADRLVDHEHMLVLVQDLQRDVLRLGMGLGVENDMQAGHLAPAHRVAPAHGLAVQQDVAGLDPLGQLGAGEFREQLGQHGVEAPSSGGIGHHGLAGGFGFGSVIGHGESTARRQFWGPGDHFQSQDRPLGYHRPFVFQPRPALTP
ncbi:hypothetical protein D3C71_1181040 [compost metagenome]